MGGSRRNEGTTFIVTGVVSGIGAETCHLLRSQGARVIGVDRTETDNADAFFLADLGDPASIDALVEALPEGQTGSRTLLACPRPSPPLW
jgi:NAD(P)-dependent dehydrogenase (short-subunit alcohol dehydrogenase family)